MLLKKIAQKIAEYSAIAFVQTMILVCIFPSFRAPIAAFAAVIFLVLYWMLTFEYFYDDPSKDEKPK